MKPVKFLLLIFIFSCSSKREIPPGILSQTKMQSIMWDMLKADEFVLNFQRKDSTRSIKDKSTLLYDEIFAIHKTTKAEFEKSITFYSQHPDLFKDVLDSMEKQKATIISQSYKPRPVDSLHFKKNLDSLRLKKSLDSARLKKTTDSLRKKGITDPLRIKKSMLPTLHK